MVTDPKTIEDAVRQYCRYMTEVKLRIANIQAFGSPPIREHLSPGLQIESIYLQFRKILELIAMGSLLNHKSAYAAAHSTFTKHWNARRIVENLRKVNPLFFPQPVENNQKRIVELHPIAHALSEAEFEELYKRTGGVLHIANPFVPGIDYKTFSNEVNGWLAKIVALLNQHKLHMLGDSGFWLIQMSTTERSEVHYSRFELVGPAKLP
jgi:hypothetical protein